MRTSSVAAALALSLLPFVLRAGESAADAAPPESESVGPDAPEDAEAARRLVDRALARLPVEPPLAELEAAALRFADADRESVDGWMSAPNHAALLPVLKVSVDHDLERDESLDRDQVDPDAYGVDTDRDLGFGISLQWKLGELIFSSDEVRVHGALANRAERREALLSVLVGHYFERRRLLLQEILQPAADPLEAVERRMRIEELTAAIDALTGGLLSRTLEKKRALDAR